MVERRDGPSWLRDDDDDDTAVCRSDQLDHPSPAGRPSSTLQARPINIHTKIRDAHNDSNV